MHRPHRGCSVESNWRPFSKSHVLGLVSGLRCAAAVSQAHPSGGKGPVVKGGRGGALLNISSYDAAILWQNWKRVRVL